MKKRRPLHGAAFFVSNAHKLEKIVNRLYTLDRAPAQDSAATARAFKALADWREHSQPGDLAQAQIFFSDPPQARCSYGAPIAAGRIFWVERCLMGGGDLALIRSFSRTLILADDRFLLAMAGAA